MTNEELVKRIDEAKAAIRQFTELDSSYVRDIDGLHNTLTFADELLQQARDAIPVWRSVEDGLPGKYQPVFYIYLGVHNQPRFCLYDPDHGSGFGREPATHWLSAIPPLPVPPADEVSE